MPIYLDYLYYYKWDKEKENSDFIIASDIFVSYHYKHVVYLLLNCTYGDKIIVVHALNQLKLYVFLCRVKKVSVGTNFVKKEKSLWCCCFWWL